MNCNCSARNLDFLKTKNIREIKNGSSGKFYVILLAFLTLCLLIYFSRKK